MNAKTVFVDGNGYAVEPKESGVYTVTKTEVIAIADNDGGEPRYTIQHTVVEKP